MNIYVHMYVNFTFSIVLIVKDKILNIIMFMNDRTSTQYIASAVSRISVNLFGGLVRLLVRLIVDVFF